MANNDLIVTETRIEAAINEITTYGEFFPTMADRRSIDIKRLSREVARELRKKGLQLSTFQPHTTSCVEPEK